MKVINLLDSSDIYYTYTECYKNETGIFHLIFLKIFSETFDLMFSEKCQFLK